MKFTLEMQKESHQMFLKVRPVEILAPENDKGFQQLFSSHSIKFYPITEAGICQLPESPV